MQFELDTSSLQLSFAIHALKIKEFQFLCLNRANSACKFHRLHTVRNLLDCPQGAQRSAFLPRNNMAYMVAGKNDWAIRFDQRLVSRICKRSRGCGGLRLPCLRG